MAAKPFLFALRHVSAILLLTFAVQLISYKPLFDH